MHDLFIESSYLLHLTDSLGKVTNNEKEFNSQYEAILQKRSGTLKERYVKVRDHYPKDFLSYVTYESRSKREHCKTKIDYDDVIVDGSEELYDKMSDCYNQIYRAFRALAYNSYSLYSAKIKRCTYGECLRNEHERLIRATMNGLYFSSSVIYDAQGLSDNFRRPIMSLDVRMAVERGHIQRVTLKELREEARVVANMITNVMAWNPDFELYFILDMSCDKNHSDSGSGGGSGGSIPTPNPGIDTDPVEPCPHLICKVCRKYIETPTRSIACNNSHPFCLKNGNCEAEFALTANKEDVELGESYVINLLTVPLELETNAIRYKIWRDGTVGNEFLLPHNDVKQFQRYATVPGTWNILVEISYGNNKTGTALLKIKHNFPTAEMIKKDGYVIATMNDAWATTKSLATATTCAEVGFYIYIKTDPNKKGEYSIPKVITGPSNSYSIVASVNLGEPNTDTPIPSKFNPLEGGTFLVASFHTHPTLSNCSDKTASWTVGPSENDAAPANGMPSFLSDYVGDKGKHKATDPINSPRTIYNFGGDQRENPF